MTTVATITSLDPRIDMDFRDCGALSHPIYLVCVQRSPVVGSQNIRALFPGSPDSAPKAKQLLRAINFAMEATNLGSRDTELPGLIHGPRIST